MAKFISDSFLDWTQMIQVWSRVWNVEWWRSGDSVNREFPGGTTVHMLEDVFSLGGVENQWYSWMARDVEPLLHWLDMGLFGIWPAQKWAEDEDHLKTRKEIRIWAVYFNKLSILPSGSRGRHNLSVDVVIMKYDMADNVWYNCDRRRRNQMRRNRCKAFRLPWNRQQKHLSHLLQHAKA
jgi:hypothetical protein